MLQASLDVPKGPAKAWLALGGTAEYQEKFFHTAEQRLLRDLPLPLGLR